MTRRLLSGVLVLTFAGFSDREMDASPSLETLLRKARLRQDSRQLPPIHLAIQVRKQPS